MPQRHLRSTKPIRVLCADPPWPFRDHLPGQRRGAAKHYPLLSIPEIKSFKLPPLADDAHLFLWRVHSFAEEAYEVMRAWGFEPKSEIVWAKLTPSGSGIHFGMGRYVRLAHEICLIGIRGKPERASRAVSSLIVAPVGRHSEKPEAFYTNVERMCAGPYAELFARRRRAGWLCRGNEL